MSTRSARDRPIEAIHLLLVYIVGGAVLLTWVSGSLLPATGQIIALALMVGWGMFRWRGTAKPEVGALTLLRIRHAYRSTEVTAALLSAAVLWPGFGLVSVVVLGGASAFIETFDYRIAIKAGAAALVAVSVVWGLWALLERLFCNGSAIASLLSLAVSLGASKAFQKHLTDLVVLSESGAGSLGTTLGISCSLGIGFVFWQHGLRLAILQADERNLVARLPGERLFGAAFSYHTGRSWHAGLWTSRVLAGFSLVAAQMAQGLATYVQLFLLGAFAFHVVIAAASFSHLLLGKGLASGSSHWPGWQIALMMVGTFGIASVASAMTTYAAIALKQFARWMSRYSFAQIVAVDPRPPILFLRSFADDQVTLAKPPLYVRYWLAEPTPVRLDHLVIERFGDTAPVVALGKETDARLPFGAAREYVPAEKWESRVLEIARSAMGVILVTDDTRGVQWETERMLQPPFVEKTLFLVSPRSSNRGLENHATLGRALAPQPAMAAGFHALAAFFHAGEWRVFTSDRMAPDDYVVCCRAFIAALRSRQRPKPSRKVVFAGTGSWSWPVRL